MSSGIQIPSQFLGRPLRLAGVPESANPFTGLEMPDAHARRLPARIPKLVATKTAEAAAITVIYPTVSMEEQAKLLMRSLDSQVVPRVGTDGRFYFTNEGGSVMHQGTPNGVKVLRALEICGAFTDKVVNGLEQRRVATQDLHNTHALVLARLLTLQPGACILETGAGSDYTRMRALDAATREKNGVLLCHDTTPASVHGARDQIGGIPYFYLPAHSYFLGDALSGLGATITLKDVISSMSFGAIAQLISCAQKSGASQMVVTQSLTLADNTNLIPQGFGAYDPAFDQFLDGNIPARLNRAGLTSGENFVYCLGTAIMRARDSYQKIILELALHAVAQLAKSSLGFEHHRAISVCCERDITNEGDIAAALNNSVPEAVPLFRNGSFNVLHLGHGGGSVDYNAEIPKGTLRIYNKQLHLFLARERVQIPLDIPPSELLPPGHKVRVTELHAREPYTPQESRFFSRHELAARLSTSLQRAAIPTTFADARRVVSTDKIREAQKIGAQFAVDFIVGILGTQMNIPLVAYIAEGNFERLRATLTKNFVTDAI